MHAYYADLFSSEREEFCMCMHIMLISFHQKGRSFGHIISAEGGSVVMFIAMGDQISQDGPKTVHLHYSTQ